MIDDGGRGDSPHAAPLPSEDPARGLSRRSLLIGTGTGAVIAGAAAGITGFAVGVEEPAAGRCRPSAGIRHPSGRGVAA